MLKVKKTLRQNSVHLRLSDEVFSAIIEKAAHANLAHTTYLAAEVTKLFSRSGRKKTA